MMMTTTTSTMMTTTTLLLVLVVVTLMTTTTVTSAFGRRNSRTVNNELVQTLRTMRRGGKQCFGAMTKCFSSLQCCHGFVCAAFDDHSGENPEIPGLCVKEKDLQLCDTDDDCLAGADGGGDQSSSSSSSYYAPSRSVCLGFDRGIGRYCLSDTIRNEIDPFSRRTMPNQKSNHVTYYLDSGRLGSVCKTSSDCNLMTDSSVPLCCKDVRRGRQGVKRMCDKVETLAPCL